MTERRVICQKFRNFVSVQLNILCLISPQYPKIALNLSMTHNEFCSFSFAIH